MQNGKTVTTGLVLRVTETKEADKILTVLTPDMGKIPLIARGARRCAGLSALRRRVGIPFYKMRFVAARIFYIPRPNWPHLHLLPAAASARFDNRLYR